MKKIFYFLLIAGIIFSCMPNKSADNKAEMNKKRVQDFYDQLINAHNADMADTFFTDDFVDHQFEPGESKIGLAGIKTGLKDFFTSMPDAHLKVNFMIASGDTVMVNATMTGTNNESVNGLPANKKPINIDGIAVFVMRDNKIAQRWRYFNDLLMMEQMGMMPVQGNDSTQKSIK
jgi:steroid delta-isomerase-like uncharacterized protein